jgi:LmbE family N-acetylglucosaminyl deacetylase
MPVDPLKMLVLGAHPDDAEFHAGGLITIYRKLGHAVKIVSVTNGAAGHHTLTTEELAAVRKLEAQAVADLTGVEFEVWDFPDGELQPSLKVRHRIIREIRTFQPDLVLTHRTNDYHPDHRAVGQAVQDASYMVTVPLSVTDVPALRSDPVVAYMADLFTKPCPLEPDVVIDVSAQFDEIVGMLDCHQSQVYQWLPYNKGVLDEVPAEPAARRKWLATWFEERPRSVADRFRSALVAAFGDAGNSIEMAEAYEISEYAAGLGREQRKRLFPVRG